MSSSSKLASCALLLLAVAVGTVNAGTCYCASAPATVSGGVVTSYSDYNKFGEASLGLRSSCTSDYCRSLLGISDNEVAWTAAIFNNAFTAPAFKGIYRATQADCSDPRCCCPAVGTNFTLTGFNRASPASLTFMADNLVGAACSSTSADTKMSPSHTNDYFAVAKLFGADWAMSADANVAAMITGGCLVAGNRVAEAANPPPENAASLSYSRSSTAAAAAIAVAFTLARN